MRIAVTQDDIDKGKPMRRMGCPIALALNRDLGTHDGRWQVSAPVACNIEYAITLPLVAVAWANTFDCRQPVEPFSFEIPDDWQTSEWETDGEG